MNPYKTSLPFIFFTIPALLSPVCPVRPSLASPVSPSPLPCSICPAHRRPEADRQPVADPKLLSLPPAFTNGLYQTRSPTVSSSLPPDFHRRQLPPSSRTLADGRCPAHSHRGGCEPSRRRLFPLSLLALPRPSLPPLFRWVGIA